MIYRCFNCNSEFNILLEKCPVCSEDTSFIPLKFLGIRLLGKCSKCEKPWSWIVESTEEEYSTDDPCYYLVSSCCNSDIKDRTWDVWTDGRPVKRQWR